MFKKPFTVKSNTNVRNSDRRKILLKIGESSADLFRKSLFSIASIITSSGISTNLYICEKQPLFFEERNNGPLYPTIYLAWQTPKSFPTLYIPEFSYIQNGADLMLPGVLLNDRIQLPMIERDSPICISIYSEKLDSIKGPVAVGRCLMSKDEMIASSMKGKGVQIFHYYQDALWEYGHRETIPIFDASEILSPIIEKQQEETVKEDASKNLAQNIVELNLNDQNNVVKLQTEEKYQPEAAAILGVGMEDCQDVSLLYMKDYFGMEHHSKCFDYRNLFIYPIRGLMKDFGNRLVVPLRVQNTYKGHECDVVVYFVIDTGSPEVTLSEATCAKLIGKGIQPSNILVQGIRFPFIRSKWSSDAFEKVNLLGTNFFLQSNTSLVFSPYDFNRPDIKCPIFYITPLPKMKKVQKLASSPNQNPSLLSQLGLESRTEAIKNFNPEVDKAVRAVSDIRYNSAYLKLKSDASPVAFAVGMQDCQDLSCFHRFFGVKNLAVCDNPALFAYPVRGMIKDFGKRLVVPLRVQNIFNRHEITVLFVVDTGASQVTFSRETHAVLTQGGETPANVLIQDENFSYNLTGNVRDDLKDVNLLGSEFFRKTKTSIIFSPHYFKCDQSKFRMFYITPFLLITGVKEIAELQIQNPKLSEKLEVKCPPKLSQSDVSANKDCRQAAQIEFSRPSTAFSYGTPETSESEDLQNSNGKPPLSSTTSEDNLSPSPKRARIE
uniref:Pre-PUA domain-containing protein n=1 Tax=Panagrolaimus sp. ES5 TaxID=591445 RepID=A0AC34GTC5_9BILA